MVLNLEVNLDFFNEYFELAPYRGLRKQLKGSQYILEDEPDLMPQQRSSTDQINDSPDFLYDKNEFKFFDNFKL